MCASGLTGRAHYFGRRGLCHARPSGSKGTAFLARRARHSRPGWTSQALLSADRGWGFRPQRCAQNSRKDVARQEMAPGGLRMKRIAPPFWLEYILMFLLSPRDRETVSGDLYEEFVGQKLS